MRLIIFILGVVYAGAAQAGVIYNWEQITPSVGGQSFKAQIEFTNEAYLSGQADGRYRNDLDGSPARCQNSLNSSQTVICTDTLDIGVMAFSFEMSGPIDNFDIPSSLTQWDLIIDAIFGATLTGSRLSLNNNAQSASFRILSGDIWSVFDVGSDKSVLSCNTTPEICEGATGRFVLDETTIPVPAPAGIGFLIFGIALIAVLKRTAE